MLKLPRQYGNFSIANCEALAAFKRPPDGDNLFGLWFGRALNDTPIYTISAPLLACFGDNDLPPLDPEFYSSPPSLFHFILALPMHQLKRDHGVDCEFIWVSYDAIDCVYRVFAIVNQDGQDYTLRSSLMPNIRRDRKLTEDPALYALIDRIVINSLLTLKYGQKLIGPCEMRGKVYQASEKPPEGRYYRYLGKDYQGCGNAPLGGTHASPRAHWRKGHFRHQACGQRLTSRRLVWIEPMYIGAD